ncbi:MAG: DCC1-like thiol-disulfide oxidoreductase family protein, partial [Candidatus Latescibacterota bacterium]
MTDNCANLYFFYDQTCALCVRFKRWVADRDVTSEVELLPLSEEGLQARFPMVYFTRDGKRFTMCNRRGEVFEGIAVLRMLAYSVPGLALVDWVYGLPGVQAVSGG